MKKQTLYVIIINALLIISVTQSCFGQQADADQTQYISKLNFIGNEAINNRKIKEILGMKIGQKFDPAIIENSILNLLNAYKKAGYMFAKVAWQQASESRNKVIININIDEGEQITIGRVIIVNLGEQLPIRLNVKKLSIQKSLYFDEAILEKDIEQILRLYSEKGYPMATVSPKVDIESGKLNLELTIDSGLKVKIKEIKINGLKKTKEQVILRELPIHSDDVFDQRKIDETERLLNNIGYFQDVSTISFSQADDGNLAVNISVMEGPTGRLNGLLGYNPSDNENESKLIGTIDAKETNLLGTGRQISLSGRRGFVDSYELTYLEPWIFDIPIDLGIHFQSADRSDFVIRQDLSEREAGLSGIFRISSSDRISLSGTYKQIKSSAISEEIFELPDNSMSEGDFANGRKYSISLGSIYDRRDYIGNPTKGRIAKMKIELSSGDFRLIKLWLDLNLYQKTFGQQVLAFGVHAGRVWGDGIPPTELFYLGGANTLRGYREEQFRGYERQFANIEYRFITGRNSHFFMFLDGGRVYNESRESGRMKFGYGVGMRLESLNGTLSMDYGLAKGDSFLKGKIHVSLGAVF